MMMKRYLADGVYAAFEPDLSSIVLTTEDGVSVRDTVVVDRDVLERLEDYAMEMRAQNLMPRRAGAVEQAERLGACVESTELVAALREALRALAAARETGNVPAGEDVFNERAKIVARALYGLPVRSEVAAVADRENVEASEIYARATTALSAAGVSHDVGCGDPLEQLAARIRVLASMRPIAPLTRESAATAVARTLMSFRHLEDELGDKTLPCYVDNVAAAVVAALGIG